MSQSPKPRGLGRGLSALLGDEEIVATVAPSPPEAPGGQAPGRPPLSLPIGHLKPGRMQPRTTFEDLDALVESVREFGLLQPILVRPVPGQSGVYEIVAGERRCGRRSARGCTKCRSWCAAWTTGTPCRSA